MFLLLVARTGNETASAHLAGTTLSTVESWKADSEFQTQLGQAHREASEWLVFKAWQRAVMGVQMPYFFKGEVAGHKRVYSDRLLLWLLNQQSGSTTDDTEPNEEAEDFQSALEQKLAQLARTIEPPSTE